MPQNNLPLSTNGLIMPSDFPSTEYESVYKKVLPYELLAKVSYEHFSGAWNAIAYRFRAIIEYEAAFTASLIKNGSSPSPIDRYQQERDLFGFFSSGFSIFESSFYGLFSIGSIISAANFPMTNLKAIKPSFTAKALEKAFPNDGINTVLQSILSDNTFLDWHEIRNILTHRSAPGRVFFEGFGGGVPIPDQWKIGNISLDSKMAFTKRAALSELFLKLMKGIDQFTQSHI
jgi:hypothetical protein